MRATVIMAGEENKTKERKEHDPIFMVCLALFLIACVGVLGVFAIDHLSADNEGTAAYGDSVTVDYTGSYYNYVGEDGAVVFDTSKKSVADNESITKSSDFSARSSYSPLDITIGSGGALELFENSIVGHKVGDKFRVMIPAGEGYVGADTTKTLPLSGFTVPAAQSMPGSAFESLYGLKITNAGAPFTTVYGWEGFAVFDSTSNMVKIYNMPEANKTYTFSPGGNAPADGEEKLTITVTSVNNDNILCDLAFKNYTAVSGDTIQMESFDFGTEKWYVEKVGSGNFTYKTSSRGTVNEDLYFEIELKSIS